MNKTNINKLISLHEQSVKTEELCTQETNKQYVNDT